MRNEWLEKSMNYYFRQLSRLVLLATAFFAILMGVITDHYCIYMLIKNRKIRGCHSLYVANSSNASCVGKGLRSFSELHEMHCSIAQYM